MASAFDNLAPRVMADLMHDFGLTPTQAAGAVGNLGAESGLRAVQEANPRSGRGGYGWAQWTGDRRTGFESWCKAQGFALDSYAANYGYLKKELSGAYAHTIEQVKKTTTIKAAAETFEHFYERAGIVNMAGRISFGNRALALYLASPYAKETPTVVTFPAPAPTPTVPTVLTGAPTPWYKSNAVWGGIIAVLSPLIARAIPAFANIDPNTAADTVIRVIDIAGPIIGGIFAVHGRVTATSPIAGTQAAQASQAIVQQAIDTPSPVQAAQPLPPEAWALPEASSFASAESQVLEMFGAMMGLPPELRAAVPTLVAAVDAIKHATGEAVPHA
jgi:hypothetical protein